MMELKFQKNMMIYMKYDHEIPTDIQVMINNNEKGLALLRIAEVIGQDKIEILMKILFILL